MSPKLHKAKRLFIKLSAMKHNYRKVMAAAWARGLRPESCQEILKEIVTGPNFDAPGLACHVAAAGDRGAREQLD